MVRINVKWELCQNSLPEIIWSQYQLSLPVTRLEEHAYETVSIARFESFFLFGVPGDDVFTFGVELSAVNFFWDHDFTIFSKL